MHVHAGQVSHTWTCVDCVCVGACVHMKRRGQQGQCSPLAVLKVNVGLAVAAISGLLIVSAPICGADSSWWQQCIKM